MGGILDFIHHAEIGSRSDGRYLVLGPIEDYTINSGFLVDRYCNKNKYSVLHPLGLFGRIRLKNTVIVQGFVSDVSNFSYGGLHVMLEPLNYYVGLGYFFDVNQYYIKKIP